MTYRVKNHKLYIIILFFDRWACAIPDNEEVIITGGWDTMTMVSVYSKTGWERDLPPLSEGRFRHACESFLFEGDRVKEMSTIKSKV